MPVDGRSYGVNLRRRGLLIIRNRLTQTVDGCRIAVDVRLQAQQCACRCLPVCDDHLINAVQLRAVTGYRCRQSFTRGHLSEIGLDYRR